MFDTLIHICFTRSKLNFGNAKHICFATQRLMSYSQKIKRGKTEQVQWGQKVRLAPQ